MRANYVHDPADFTELQKSDLLQAIKNLVRTEVNNGMASNGLFNTNFAYQVKGSDFYSHTINRDRDGIGDTTYTLLLPDDIGNRIEWEFGDLAIHFTFYLQLREMDTASIYYDDYDNNQMDVEDFELAIKATKAWKFITDVIRNLTYHVGRCFECGLPTEECTCDQ